MERLLAKEKTLTPEEYLQAERHGLRETQGKYEYHNGQLIPMGGASKEHNKISVNLSGFFWYHLQDKPYEVYHSDMRTYVPARESYYYPDLVVIEGEPVFRDQEFDNLLNPYLIVEIVSPSSSSYDRGDKFVNYRSIDMLHEYLVVSSQKMYVEYFHKVKGNEWKLSIFQHPHELVPLLNDQLSLTLEQIYKNVAWKSQEKK